MGKVYRSRPLPNRSGWTKEQIRHFVAVLEKIATAQFIFLAGKNLYLHTLSDSYDWLVLILSAIIFFLIHGIIHELLIKVGD